jgi:hypothetical protein
MTRTDVMASSRPQTPGAATMNRRSSTVRALVALPIVALLALALLAPGTAFGAEETATYGTPPPPPTTPTTTPTTPTTPTTGTSPEKSSEEPTTTTSTPKETTPTSSSSPAKEASAKTLPFTGFNLSWSFGIGLVLMGAGFSIVMMQRRRREGGR